METGARTASLLAADGDGARRTTSAAPTTPRSPAVRVLAWPASEDLRENETPAGSAPPMAGSSFQGTRLDPGHCQKGMKVLVRGSSSSHNPMDGSVPHRPPRSQIPPDAGAPGRDGRTNTAMARSATAVTLCSDRTAGGLAAQAAGIDMGVMDRRPVSAIEAEWRKRAAGVVPAQPNERPDGRYPSFQVHVSSITETTLSA